MSTKQYITTPTMIIKNSRCH